MSFAFCFLFMHVSAAASWPDARCVGDGPAGRQHVVAMAAAGLLGRAAHITRVRHGPTCLAALATPASSAPGRRSPSLPLRRLMISSPSPSPSPLDKAMIYIYIYICNFRLFTCLPISLRPWTLSGLCTSPVWTSDPNILNIIVFGVPTLLKK